MTRKLVVAVVGVVVAAVISGCSGGGGDTSDTTSTTGVTLATVDPAALASAEPKADFCGVLETMGSLDPFGASGAKSPEALRLAFSEVATVLQQLVATTPRLVEQSAVLLRDAIATLSRRLDQYDFDLDAAVAAGDAPAQALYDDPSFAVAGANLLAYKQTVCGITR